MASKRMFALTIIDSDAFLDMPQSTQLLYFHLGMRADDDGFINNAKTIMRVAGCKEDDLKLLIAKKFIICFENGIMVIKHWNINNYIQKDRYHETKYIEEKQQLNVDDKGAYTFNDGTPALTYRVNKEQQNKRIQTPTESECIQDVYEMDTEIRLGKDSIDKVSIVKDSKEYKEEREKENKINVHTHEDYSFSNQNELNEVLDRVLALDFKELTENDKPALFKLKWNIQAFTLQEELTNVVSAKYEEFKERLKGK